MAGARSGGIWPVIAGGVVSIFVKSKDSQRIAEDMRKLTQASGILGLSEYAVFEKAYAEWFGRAGDGRTLDDAFGRYLRGRGIPYWVRSYIRSVCGEPGSRFREPRSGAARYVAGAAILGVYLFLLLITVL